MKTIFLTTESEILNSASNSAGELVDAVADDATDVIDQSQEAINRFTDLIPHIIVGIVELFILWILIALIIKILMVINHKYMRKQEGRLSVTRAETIASIIDDVIKYVMGIIGIFLMLPIFGVSPTMVAAGGGIFAIFIATTGSTLLSDFINGFFALFEGYYDVGDYIETDGYEGTVEALGIKSTVLRTPNQNIITIPNSSIISVVNYAKLPYVQFVDVSISYNASIIEVENIIYKHFLPKFKQYNEYKVSYLGVSALGESSVSLKFELISDVQVRYPIQRLFFRECKLTFDEFNVEIPFNQLVVTHLNDKNSN